MSETGLPSEHFHLADEYREMDETEAKVELQERTKELGAIKRANELFVERDDPVDTLIRTYADELPQWFQYPDVTEAQIVVGDAVAESAGFERTAHPLSTSTETDSGTTIQMEIVYTKQRPDEDDGPWLTEEQELIDALISFIKSDVNQRENRKQLERRLANQREVANDVEASVSEVTKTARNVATDTDEINERVQRAKGSMDNVASEVADMSATIEEVASTANQVAETS